MQRTIKELQTFLGVEPDGSFGPKSMAALEAVLHPVKTAPNELHSVIASVFADAADLEAFRKCKAQGKSDEECFAIGDNGIGLWGESTAPGTGPSVALSPEDMEEGWGSVNAAKSKKVDVTYKTTTVTCVLKDRMPHRANIRNGAGIDLNEDARQMLGIPKGAMVRVTWKWNA